MLTNRHELFGFKIWIFPKKKIAINQIDKKKCSICEDVCVWDKTVKYHLDINLSLFGLRNGNSDTYCTECWQAHNMLPCTIS